MSGIIIEHPAQWPKPEQLQMEPIGRLNATDFCVVPIAASAITRQASATLIQSAVHLRVVSESGHTLTRADLDRAAIEPVDLQKLCLLKSTEDKLRLKYLGVHAVSAKIYSEQCFVDDHGEVHVTFILCTRGFMISKED